MPLGGDPFVVFDAAVAQEREQWLDLWHRWPDHEVWAHPDYVQLFSRPSDRVLCACLNEISGGILFPLIVRSISEEPWATEDQTLCDLISPYGYGGPFGWGTTDTLLFWKCFDEWAHAINAVSLFTRCFPAIDRGIPFVGETITKGASIVVSLNQAVEAMWQGYARSIRLNIRTAERAGVTVVSDPHCERLDEFLTVYYATMDRLGAMARYYYPKSLFRELIVQLPGQVALFHALHQNRVVSSELVLLSQRSIYSFLGGTLPEGRDPRAHQLLRHAVNMWGKEQGKERVVLGGGYSGDEDTLFRYKKKFSPNGTVPFILGTHIFDHNRYQSLAQDRRKWETAHGNEWCPQFEYFPLYHG